MSKRAPLGAAVLLLVFASSSPAVPEVIDVPAPAGSIDLPAYTRTILANGLVVLLMENAESPLVHIRLTVQTGSADDPKGKEGLASLTAELLMAGTSARSAEQIASEIDFAGGTLEAATDADNTIVTSEFLARDVSRQLDLLSDVTLRPAFAATEADRLRQQRLAEIAALVEDASAYADAQFEAAVFGGTPYAHPALGLRTSVASLTRDDVAAFHRARYAPNQSVLAVVGSFKTAEMLQLIRTAFGGWERREVTRTPIAAPPALSGRRVALVDFPSMNQTQIRIGTVGIRRSDPDFVPIQVANAVLSSGLSSRLTEEIRVNRALTYDIRSVFDAGRHPGSHSITTFTKNATTREIIDAAFTELKKFREGPIREDEMKRARNMFLMRTMQQLETSKDLAEMISTIEVFGLPKDYVETLTPRVRALTPAVLAPIIRKHFEIDNVLILIFATAAEIRQQLEGLGPVTVKSYAE
jgi:zinc protease